MFIKGFLLFVLLLTIVFRIYFFYQTKSNYINGQVLTFQTTLLSEPKTSANQQRFSVVLEDGERIFVVIPPYPQFHYGDVIQVSGTVKKRMITNEKVFLAMYFPKITAKGRSSSGREAAQNFSLALTSLIRQKITTLFQNTLSQANASLLLGITFGIKEDIPKEFYENLKTSGVLHVVAASGMNVTMLAGALSSILIVFFRRQIALVLTIFGILFYALLSGLEASIVRASIMGMLVFTAQILGRQYMASYALFLAGAGMLFLDPRLLFDIGFQLSFMATLGLIYIRPLFTYASDGGQAATWTPPRWTRYLGEDLQTTIAAQVATLPILLANFGTYSILSVVVNGLVLWTIPILMLIGGAGAVVGLVFEFLGQAILYLSIPFLLYFTEVVELFSTNGAVMAIDSFPWQWIIGYYCVLLAVALYAQKSRFH